ncbi:MAG: hypothetical protein K2H87_02900 [Duncaniella sp.]|nr:hypothetical protein [Duncaniella sp.]
MRGRSPLCGRCPMAGIATDAASSIAAATLTNVFIGKKIWLSCPQR